MRENLLVFLPGLWKLTCSAVSTCSRLRWRIFSDFKSISPPVSVMIIVDSLYPAWLTAMLKFFSAGGWIPVAVTALGGTIIFSLRLRKRRLEILENADANFDKGNLDPLTQNVPGLAGSNELPRR